MKYVRKFYEFLVACGEVVYEYRKHNNVRHYY
jgi:hypothetical protein